MKEVKSRFTPYVTSSLFWSVLLLKIVSGSIFGSHYLRDLFIPFVSYFVDSGFANPWDEFLRRGATDAFPYSSTMLLAFTGPQWVAKLLFGSPLNMPEFLQLLLMRLPLLVCDVAIYLILCRWFNSARRSVLILYWCSPILFYISYVYGHFDVIPTAFLFVSIVMALHHKPAWGGIFLGLGIGAKFHLAAAVPLLAFFIAKNAQASQKRSAPTIYLLSLIGVVALLVAPVIQSEGYRALVLAAKESRWVMEVAWPMPNDLRILICPAAAAALILHFFSYNRLTRDVLVLYTGLLYAILIVLVPPQTGWGYWCVPFLCYFLIRQDAVGYAPFWVYTLSYLVYFGVLAKDVALFPVDPMSFSAERLDLLRQIVFTVMQTSLALVAVWVYRIGIRSYARYKSYRPHIAVAIAGDSGSGKHMLAETLSLVTGALQTVRLHGDDYHRYSRESKAWENMTHLDPRSNYFQEPIKHIIDLKNGLNISTARYDHATGSFTPPVVLHPCRFILFEGLHPFVFQRMRDVFDIKIFLDTDENLRRYWKIRRDTAQRGHSAQKVMTEIERRETDASRYVRPQAEFADWIVRYSSQSDLDAANGAGDLHLRVRHEVSNQIIEIESLMDELSKMKSEHFHTDWYMSPDLKRQVLEVEGKLPASDVERIASAVFPDLADLLRSEPQWLDDLQGLNQLIFIAILNNAFKNS